MRKTSAGDGIGGRARPQKTQGARGWYPRAPCCILPNRLRFSVRAKPQAVGDSPLLREVHFDVGEGDLPLVLEGGVNVEDLLPVAGATTVFPIGVALRFALAVDAVGCVRQRVESGDADLVAASLTHAVGAVLELGQGP